MDCTTNRSCCVCAVQVTNGWTEPINEHQARCIALVLNFESCFLNAEAVSEFNFLHGLPCSNCHKKLIETESLIEDWELLRSRLKSTARELRQILSASDGFTKGPTISKTEIKKESGLVTRLRSRIKTLVSPGNHTVQEGIYFNDFLIPKFPYELVADAGKCDADETVLSKLESDNYFNGIRGQQTCNTLTNTSFDLADPNCVPQNPSRWSEERNTTSKILDSNTDTSTGYATRNKAFTIGQMRTLHLQYKRLKCILSNSRFDDPNVEIRRVWELVAKEVNEVGGPTKSAAQCWKKLQLIIRKEVLHEASRYKVQCPNGEFTLKHCQLVLQRCEGAECTVPRRKILKSKVSEATSLGQYCPPDGKLETCSFPNCEYSTTDSDRLRGHYNREHLKDAYPFKCIESNCGKSYMSYFSFNVHRGKHVGYFPFSCDQCDRKFTRKVRLLRHKYRCHEERTPDYQCHLCAKWFFFFSGFSYHFDAVHSEKTMKCSVIGCDATFSAKAQLEIHCRNKHSDEYPNLSLPSIMCPECGKLCDGESKFKKHSLIHRGLLPTKNKPDKNFQCSNEGCHYKASNRTLMRKHVINVHETSGRNVICPYENCGTAFKTEACRSYHISTKHEVSAEKLKKCECPICGYILNSRFALKIHIAVKHTTGNERDFVCEKCDRGFQTKLYFLKHQKRFPDCQPKKPPGPKAVQCEICQAYCCNYTGLKRHYVLLHQKDGEKSWKCPWCGKCWPIKMYLTRHELRCKLKPKNDVSCNNRAQSDDPSIRAGKAIETTAVAEQIVSVPSELDLVSIPHLVIVQQHDNVESICLLSASTNQTVLNPVHENGILDTCIVSSPLTTQFNPQF